MQSFCKRAAAGAALLVLTTAAACGDSADSMMATDVQAPNASTAQGTPAPNERLAHLMALSLRDASVRALLQRSFAASPVSEGKLHLGAFLQGSGRALLNAMSRAAGVPETEILGLVRDAGSLEFYLPVPAHRSQWQGGQNLIVATQMQDHTVPAGFALNGERVALSAETAPATPVISLVSAESFDEQGQPYHRAASNGGSRAVGPSFTHSTTGTMWTGLWVNYVYIPGDYEGWARGAPEYEMYLERGADRTKIRCAAEPSVEPFKWNMDGTSYDADFLVGWDQETPTLEGLLIYVYEDDDTECAVKVGKDYVKLAVDALTNANATHKAVGERQWDQAVVAFKHAAVAFWSIITGGDEFVGVISVDGDVTTAPRRALIKNDNAVDKGWVDLQWKTDTAH